MTSTRLIMQAPKKANSITSSVIFTRARIFILLINNNPDNIIITMNSKTKRSYSHNNLHEGFSMRGFVQRAVFEKPLNAVLYFIESPHAV